jgi:peptide-methionine (S)-S-oxide reductase
MGDHTECFQVDFDSREVSYEDLLELFWTTHDPARPAWKTQYASLALAHDDAQLATARESAQRFSAIVGRSVATRIETLGRFWLAEDYHQKYYLRNDRVLMGDFRAMFGADDRAFVDSPAAARVNGYLSGAESCARLERELPGLGLSPEGATHLRSRCR